MPNPTQYRAIAFEIFQGTSKTHRKRLERQHALGGCKVLWLSFYSGGNEIYCDIVDIEGTGMGETIFTLSTEDGFLTEDQSTNELADELGIPVGLLGFMSDGEVKCDRGPNMVTDHMRKMLEIDFGKPKRSRKRRHR